LKENFVPKFGLNITIFLFFPGYVKGVRNWIWVGMKEREGLFLGSTNMSRSELRHAQNFVDDFFSLFCTEKYVYKIIQVIATLPPPPLSS
jgi:hypothetical protein